ncbi:ABC transporter permease [Paenibacillus sp. UNC499MF]|uniref:ABC transporter permease n=1 Tax=Paenibacillus sp. UNC499MF TaxID=1502751 RepID=UPI00089F9F4F|nr:ABC transporter permease [Paenibacillus sp. UNC499MF]SEG11016.1 hypothetical protein SAMN02799616_01891 [Paenibacillus sp. UNC499MF]
MIVSEAIRSLKNWRFFSILIVIQFTISFIVLNAIWTNLGVMKKSEQHYATQLQEKPRYELSDKLKGEEERSFLGREGVLEDLKGFYKDLTQQKEFTFLERILQPVYVANFRGSEKFTSGYEDGREPTYYQSNDLNLTFVKAAAVNEQTWKEFSFRTSEGRAFDKSDFSVSNQGILPAVLGYEYQDVYKIGDHLQIQYYFKNFTMEIVGFLEKNSVMPARGQGELLYLDRYIVLPSVVVNEPPVTEEDYTFQKTSNLTKLSGTVQLENGYTLASFAANFEELRQRYQMFDFDIWNSSPWELKILKFTAGENIGHMLTIGLLMAGFAVLTLSVIMSSKIRRNRSQYGVHLLCGGSMRHITGFVLLENLLIFATAHLLAFLITLLLFGDKITYSPIWIGLSLVLLLTSSIQPLVHLRRLNVDTMLRRKD